MDTSRKRRRNHNIIDFASSEHSPAAELIANNVDLLTQIFLCFPPKSLIQFKSVSKHWLSLISDSQFVAKFSCRKPSISGLFLSLRVRNSKTENTKFVLLDSHANRPMLAFLDTFGVAPRITDSCNGLLLCDYRTHFILSSDHYLVCNPTTKTHKLIRAPPEFPSHDFLAFDPSKSPHFKIVSLGDCTSKVKEFSIYVYCSERTSWKPFRVPHGRLTNQVRFETEVLCGGVIYWLSDEGVVLGFDIDSEKMIEKINPQKIPFLAEIIYFGECDGRLIVIQTHFMSTLVFRILEMDKDYHGWIVKFVVDPEPLISMKGKFCYYSVLCVVPGDKENDFQLVLDCGGKVISYNLRSQTWIVLHVMAPGKSVTYRVNPYIESIAPL